MKGRTTLLIAGSAVALLLLALLFGLSDLRELGRRVGELRWGWVAASAVVAVASYLCIAGCHRSLLALIGHEVAWRVIGRAVLVSTVTNRSVRSGGATGFALLSWLLARRGIPASAVLTSTAGFLLITNALFGALFVASVPVAGLRLGGEGARAAWALGLAAVGFTATLALGGALVFHEGLRARWSRRALRAVAGLGRRLHRAEWESRATSFFSRFDVGARLLLERRRATGPAWAWAAVRIATSIGCLWLCVQAAGLRLDPAALLLAYTVSKTVGVVSLVPAGLGLVEGSLVGVFVAFGVPYEVALLAALLNRAVYHALPAALALAVFGPLVREARARSVGLDDGARPGP